MASHATGDLITGEIAEPDVAVNAAQSARGLFDSLTGSVGIPVISSREKQTPASVATSTPYSDFVLGGSRANTSKTGY